MAHRVIGIDLGTYSVKLAELEAGFRQSRLVGLYEKVLLPKEGEESHVERAARTVRALMDEWRLEAEMYATSMGGEATLRQLSMPFSDAKKIEQVLGFELESQILENIEDLVFDHVVSKVGPDSTSVIAAAMPQERVKAVVTALQGVRIEPRVVGAAALAYGALPGLALEPSEATRAIVDLGHMHTNVCVIAGSSVAFARSIARGGAEVTQALADTFRIPIEEATRAKHEQAFIAEAKESLPSPQHRQVSDCVKEAVRPLVRDLKQTLAAHRATGGEEVRQIILAGGGAQLRGFADHLARELGVTVEMLSIAETAPLLAEGREPVAMESSVPSSAQALGLAIAVAASVPQVNLRRGPLAYRTDYSYLRGKVLSLAIGVVAVVIFAGINAWASLRSLKKEAEQLETQMKKETLELFGESRLDGKAVSEELRAGPRGGAPPAPILSAFEVLEEISRTVPSKSKIRLDVLELDIKPKKTYLKATVESKQHVDDLTEALEKIDCFEKIDKGKISTVTAPGAQNSENKDAPAKLQEFNLTIDTKCP